MAYFFKKPNCEIHNKCYNKNMRFIFMIFVFVGLMLVSVSAYPVDNDSVYRPLPGEDRGGFDASGKLKDEESTELRNPNDYVYQPLPGEDRGGFYASGKLKDEESTKMDTSNFGLLPGEEIKSFNAQGKLVDDGSVKEDESVYRRLPGLYSSKDYNKNGSLTNENATDDKTLPVEY